MQMQKLETRLRYVPASHMFGLHKLQVPFDDVQFDKNVPWATREDSAQDAFAKIKNKKQGSSHCRRE